MGSSPSKRCFKCRQRKDRSEFYAHPRMADGLLGKCKSCTKRDVRRWYRATKEERRAYERRRGQRPARKEAARRYSKTPAGKASIAASHARSRARYPEKYRARTAVGNALRDGRLRKGPCEKCGATEKVEGHHEDYKKPLDVRWLCHPCHRREEGRSAA